MNNSVTTTDSGNVNNSHARWRDMDNKEVVDSRKVVAIVNGEIISLGVATWYMSKSADGAGPMHCNFVRYCTTNGRGGDDHRVVLATSGYGVARGYGYCKKSASFAYAIMSARLHLKHPIDGLGDSAITGAFEAIARDTLINLGMLDHDSIAIINLHR